MIPLVKEPEEYFKEFGVYEKCYFGCGKSTPFWHCKTNQPICKECAKQHKVDELPKSHPKYKPLTKKQFKILPKV